MSPSSPSLTSIPSKTGKQRPSDFEDVPHQIEAKNELTRTQSRHGHRWMSKSGRRLNSVHVYSREAVGVLRMDEDES
jgi:hypothetical protein